MSVFFIRSTDITESVVLILPPLSLHLSKSLRIQVGETLSLVDEHRRRHYAKVTRVEKNRLFAEIQKTQIGPPLEVPSLILYQAVLKNEKMTWVIQKATELGVNQIVPLLSERVIPRFNEGQKIRHHERWQRIALEAAQQSERWEVPILHPIQSFSSLSSELDSEEMPHILVEREKGDFLSVIPFPSHGEQKLSLIVGPEGGWTETELAQAEHERYRKVSLGERILRAETASLVGLAIIQSRFGRI